MQIASSFKQDRFFALKTNGSIQELSSLDSALKSKDNKFVIIDKCKEFFTPYNGYPWRLSNFTFVNGENIPFELSDSNWTIKSIDTTFKSANRIEFTITLSDPNNVVRRIRGEIHESRKHNDGNAHDLKLVVYALERLYEHSIYINWEQVDLQNENRILKEKIESLQQENNTLKTKLTEKINILKA